MHDMTELACPVCATPYEAGTTTCAFCGVSLVEPGQEAKPEPEVETPIEVEALAVSIPETETPLGSETPNEIEALVESASEIETPVEVDESAGIEATPADASEPPSNGIDDTIADESPSPAGKPESADSGGIAEIPGIQADSASPAPSEPRSRTPSFARKPTSANTVQRRLQRIEWSVVGGLAALLLVQVVASDFDQLAAGSATRPWLQRVCSALRCTLPPWREPQALRMLQRDVHANPRRPGLLRVSASFRNDARWTQPWPRLRITLADADGRAIAARDFSANEYLGTTPTANGIASGQVAGIAFDVVDPSPRVTAFTFEFR
ncbi:DUF3426 domain-containing protein [Pseudoluteimonas lycopersici]|uniref:DUF3426 domain-containing protein n=1 Tax=Pseudoluteimonas lycopersici TaxID=1324796 RepID=A0A516V5E2_9GAMM|nr:DUF3426 domain-containing protein [Lysobacter lycopersici]QDQ73743.1 DUF3426 domain-containing protein [Lysobacter lycopersici]